MQLSFACLLISVLSLSLSSAAPTPTSPLNVRHHVTKLRQATREDLVSRSLRGPYRRDPAPSSAPAPNEVTTSRDDSDNGDYSLFYSGSGKIWGSSPSGDGADEDEPLISQTYPRTTSQNQAIQNCVDYAYSQDYYGVQVYWDTSDNLWHCVASYDEDNTDDFSTAYPAANPVFGYNIIGD